MGKYTACRIDRTLLIRSTFMTGENPTSLWTSLLNLTRLVYQELEGNSVPVTQEMIMISLFSEQRNRQYPE